LTSYQQEIVGDTCMAHHVPWVETWDVVTGAVLLIQYSPRSLLWQYY